jgi:hypothetical protein
VVGAAIGVVLGIGVFDKAIWVVQEGHGAIAEVDTDSDVNTTSAPDIGRVVAVTAVKLSVRGSFLLASKD